MLAEFLNGIVNLAKGANAVSFHTNDQVPDTVFIRHGDQLLEKATPPPKRRHALAGFDDLVAALKDPDIAPDPEVYLDKGGVTVLLDRSERRETVRVALAESTRLLICRTFEAQPKTMQPREAVKLLRLELHSGRHDHVIQALSRIDFTRSSAGKSHVDHGKESMGRSVEAAVQQADSVPKDFEVAVPVWTNPGFSRYSVNVKFGLFLDLDNQAVELRVLSDECSRVVTQTLAAVAADLREALPDVPVFLGAP